CARHRGYCSGIYCYGPLGVRFDVW
nr:immunoglobulin heavy chain junction region [Macaca mulatta]MOW20772.1 immunoglobulin heavy chain junction region [Macaca mulatta]MOW21332.1 immunoglobulin heavy chain junction region [Macaca mulatta]MOW21498.1 immunoglobulin heavy chain junction region [Macaca mulatta]MOW22404.1 immunoglobulin heavy chain junction region [Macaca mulatta]